MAVPMLGGGGGGGGGLGHLEAPGVRYPIVTIRVVVIHPVGHVAAEVALDTV